jgi:hypothetical protein
MDEGLLFLVSAERRMNIGNLGWDHDYGPVYEMK